MEKYENIEGSFSRFKINKLLKENSLVFTPIAVNYSDIARLIERFSARGIKFSKNLNNNNLKFFADTKAKVMIFIYKDEINFYWWKIRITTPRYIAYRSKKYPEYNIKQVIKRSLIAKPNWNAYQLVIDGGSSEESLKEFIWSNRVHLKYNEIFGKRSIKDKNNYIEPDKGTVEKISKTEMFRIVNNEKGEFEKVEPDNNSTYVKSSFSNVEITEEKYNTFLTKLKELKLKVNEIKEILVQYENETIALEKQLEMIDKKNIIKSKTIVTKKPTTTKNSTKAKKVSSTKKPVATKKPVSSKTNSTKKTATTKKPSVVKKSTKKPTTTNSKKSTPAKK